MKIRWVIVSRPTLSGRFKAVMLQQHCACVYSNALLQDTSTVAVQVPMPDAELRSCCEQNVLRSTIEATHGP
jgi:hypothetical protein